MIREGERRNETLDMDQAVSARVVSGAKLWNKAPGS